MGPQSNIASMTDTATGAPVFLTEAALTKVSQLLSAEEEDLALRVGVHAGGCAGLRYQLYFDDEISPEDTQYIFGEVRVVVDAASAPYLVGARIDYADTIAKQGFTIDNPNARGTCACGDSFC